MVITHTIRQALAHERAAGGHDNKYEQQMKAAGASMFAAFQAAAQEAPELRGRKLDDTAWRRIFHSNKPRPWWTKELNAAGMSGKNAGEHAQRLIQWHLDPEAAQARRGGMIARLAANNKRLSQNRKSSRSGGQTPRAAAPPSTAEMRSVSAASQETALAGRELPPETFALLPTTNDLLGEVSRISAAVRRVGEHDHETVLEILRVTAREVERYVP